MLLALLLAGAFAPETGELAVTLPAASDFLFTDDSLGTPHFDATGDHVVWTRSRGNRWSLLRAKSDDLENPSELLSLDWSQAQSSIARTAGIDTNGVLLHKPEGYQLQILHRDEKAVTVPIPLSGDAILLGINDGEEALILHNDGLRHAYYRL